MKSANPLKFEDGQNFGESVRGLKWDIEEVDERIVLHIAQRLNIAEILAVIMYNRDVRTVEEAELFLDPKLRSHMPNPFHLKDMNKAADRIAQAVINQNKIAVIGDYDVDGATSTALLKRFFKSIDCDVEIYIPNRITEGYGPSIEAFDVLHNKGNKLVITVDCGTVSFEPIEHAKKIGIDVIVLDHHLSSDVLPEAYAIVNPNRIDETFIHKSIAAVGIAFLAVVAIKSKLKEYNYFRGRIEPDNLMLLDLVALGTVCDVMNLKGVNRAFVSQGLKLINNRFNIGLATLSNIANLESAVQSYHLGFVLGPRINAGGRIGEGLLGSELLSTTDAGLAMEISLKLERLNDERRSLESIILESAIAEVELHKLYDKSIILVSGNDWHQGILGIIASRLKEKYCKPSAVISFNSTEIGKGSARSINGIDIGTILAEAKLKNLLIQGGGHPMAGGFTVEKSKIQPLYDFICNKLGDTNDIMRKSKSIKIDYILSLTAINDELLRIVNKAAPFGAGNNQPRFLVKKVIIVSVRIVGKSHIMFIVSDKNNLDDSHTVKCMMFKVVNTELGEMLLNGLGKTVNIVGTLQAHYLNPNKVDFIVDDMRFES